MQIFQHIPDPCRLGPGVSAKVWVSMDGIVGPIKAYLRKRDPATIDNFAFKLHYRITFVVMLVCMMLVSARYLRRLLILSIVLFYRHLPNIYFFVQIEKRKF